MTQTNRSREHERIAFGRPIDWDNEARYGTVFFGPEKAKQFPSLPVGTAVTLLETGYLDPDYRHNDAPPASVLVEWASRVRHRFKERQMEIGLIGYMVSPERDDSRTGLTGISMRSPKPLPDGIQREIAREFDPDLFQVDDFTVQIEWD